MKDNTKEARSVTDTQWRKRLLKFDIGQKVEVYGLIGCVDFIGIKTIKAITPMNSSPGSLPMIYFAEGGGAHHVGAIKKIELKLLKSED